MSASGTDSRERIMDATYQALVQTGYADLTMSDIAAESETSTGLLHYHFDTKQELLVAFLDHLLEKLEARLDAMSEEDPVGRLFEVMEWFVLTREEVEREAFTVALLELRSQAPYDDRYRERMRQADHLLREALADIVRDGIETGVFHECDPDAVATLLLAAMDGARSRQLIGGQAGYAVAVRDALFEHVLADFFTDEAAERWTSLRVDEEAE